MYIHKAVAKSNYFFFSQICCSVKQLHSCTAHTVSFVSILVTKLQLNVINYKVND